MMKFLNNIVIVLLTGFMAVAANAYVVNDVRTFNEIHINDFIQWEYHLADYGFVAGRDIITRQPILTMEFRDPDTWPGKEWPDQPFLMLFVEQARYFKRVDGEDWVENIFFDEQGRLAPGIVTDEIPVWLGDVTLNFEFTPGPVVVAEPAPILLTFMGLLMFGLRQYRFQKNNRF